MEQVDVKDIIASMSIELKVGQLFLLAYPGKDPRKIAPLIDRFGICGCFLSHDNAETFKEAAQTSELLQRMASQTEHKLPMVLGVDQEGAWGVLIPESSTGPGNLALGANADKNIVHDMYRVFGQEMLSVGYNTLLAPCADVIMDPRSPIIGARSFGDRPSQVAELVALAVEGARKTGILTTLKHFPGHGGTSGDSHREIPLVDRPFTDLLKTDLLPFISGIKHGADMIMTSHILYPKIDSSNPATLSKIILQDILRHQLEFSGVILSDSMNMGAIQHHYDPADSAVMALKAGVDIVMLSEEHYDHSEHYLDRQIAMLERVCQAVYSGELPEEEVDAKLHRIISMKHRMLKTGSLSPHLSLAEKMKISQQAASGAICLLRNDFNIWPVRVSAKEETACVCVNSTPRCAYGIVLNPRGIGPNQAEPAYDALRRTLEAAECKVKFLEMHEAKSNSEVLVNSKLILLVTEDYPLPGEDMEKNEQQKFVQQCLKKYRQKCVVLGLRSPYELLKYQGKLTYLCSYSSRTCSAEAMAKLLVEGTFPNGVNHTTL